MARKWLYFPFKDISKDTSMPQNKLRYEEKYGEDLSIAFKGDSLRTVQNDEMLIIAGHGLPKMAKIGVTTETGLAIGPIDLISPTQITTTANDLADELLAAKLPVTHKYIKLITCGGAGMVSVDDAKAKVVDGKVTAVDVVLHTHDTDCLGSVLAKALGQKGYDNIMVKAYPGFVNATGAVKSVSVEGISPMSQVKEKNFFGQDKSEAKLGSPYWRDGKIGMVPIPSKLLNDFWFDRTGDLKRQHISLK
jgi:hypothetical protein